MAAFVDRTGKRYGALLVLRKTTRNARFQWNWMCLCDCGNKKEVFGGNLHSGHTTSCGCLKGKWVHGENQINKRSPEYQALAGLIQRCTNPKSASYHLYGGRGIKVCERWDSVAKINNFIEDMGRRPSPKHSIDRWPDKNGNYEPGNCRWATVMEQQSNTRKNVYRVFDGEALHLAEIARRVGMKPSKLGYRLRHGWEFEEAIKW